MPNKILFICFTLIFILSSCTSIKKESIDKTILKEGRKSFEAAEQAFTSKNYEKAKILYKIFIDKHPESSLLPEAYLKSGLISELENKKAALDIYLDIIKKYPDSAAAQEAVIRAGNIFIDEGKYDSALKIAEDFLSKHISDYDRTRILYIKIKALLYNNKPYEAIEICKRIIEIDPDKYQNIRPFISKAASVFNKKQLLKAESLFKNQDAVALMKKYFAVLLLREKKFKEAAKILNDIINEYPYTETAEEAKIELENILSRNKWKIGCILPLSGQFQTFGEMGMKAIQLAVSNFNASNPEIEIKLFIEDNNSLESGSEKAALNLAEKKVSVIIGPFHTGNTAAEVAEKYKIPIMIMTHKPDITKDRTFVFRNFVTPSMQAMALVGYAKNILKKESFAVLYPKESYGKNFMNAFWDAVDIHNCTITGVESYDPDASDFSKSIKKLTGLYYKELRKIEEENEENNENISYEEMEIDSEISPGQNIEIPSEEEKEIEPVIDFQAIFIPDGSAKAGSIAPQLAYFDVTDILYLGPNLWQSSELSDYSEGYIKEAIFTTLFYNESIKPAAKRFTQSYEAVFEEKPGFIQAIIYDSAMFVFSAAMNAGVPSPESIRNSLVETPFFHGVTGNTSFDIKGECKKEITLLNFKNNKTKEIKIER